MKQPKVGVVAMDKRISDRDVTNPGRPANPVKISRNIRYSRRASLNSVSVIAREANKVMAA